MGDTSGQRLGRAEKRDEGGVTVPAEYLAHLLELCARFHVSSERLLRGTGIKPAMLEGPSAVVLKSQFMEVVERALTLTGEPGLGFYHGLSLKLSSHGALGMLAMTSGTLRDAVLVAERFMQLRAPELSLQTHLEGDVFVVEFHNQGPAQLQVFFSESMFIMLLQLGRALVGHAIPVQCEMPFPEPAHFRRFAHLIPEGARFGATANRMRMPAALLNEAVVTSDAVMARRIARECEKELSALRERASFLSTLRRHVRPEQGDFPALEEVAVRMGSSTRTIKRKLAEQGTTYRALVDGLRRDRAAALLRTGDLPLDKVADLLGYRDVASLHRSFRRWFKSTPDAYRREL